MTPYLIPWQIVPKPEKPPIVRGGKKPTRSEAKENRNVS